MTGPENNSSIPKPVEDALRESEAKFRILAETAASAIFIFQGEKLRYVSPATEVLTGYTRDELLRMKFYELVEPGKRRVYRNWGLKLQRGTMSPVRDEFKIVTKSGEVRWIDLTSGVIEYEGKPAGIGTAFDITERKRAEQLQDAVYRIARAADQAEHLDDLFPAVHAIIAEVMNARNFYIALYDREKDLLGYPYFVDEVNKPVPPGRPGKGLTEYVLRAGKPILVGLAVLERLQVRGEIEQVGVPPAVWLGVPLIVENNVIGVMVVQHYSDYQAYGPREERMLEFVSSQVAMVINRKRAEDAIREEDERYHRHAEELAALYETTRDLSAPRDLSTLLNTVADRVISLMKSPGCNIFLFDEERGDLEAVVSRGWPGLVGLRLQKGEGLAGQVAQSLTPVIMDDYRVWECRSDKFDGVPATAVIEVPMLYSGELVGVLTVFELDSGYGAVPRKYTQAEADLLAVFAGSAAGAVHNARLFEETRQRFLELEVLYQASLAATQIHSLRAVAQRVVETLGQLKNWQHGSIWVVDATAQKPALLALSRMGLTDDGLRAEMDRRNALVTGMDYGIVGRVCSTGLPVRIGDVKTDPNYQMVNLGTTSELCVPLKVGGKTIGCINIESDKPDAFGVHDERLLTTLANQAAVTVENARLFEETRRRAVRQAALNAIIIAATRPGSDLDMVLNTALEQMLQALGFDMGAVWLVWSPYNVQRVAARGMPSSLTNMMTDAMVIGEIPPSRMIAVNDWSQVKSPLADTFDSLGIRSALIMPMTSKERRIGGLAVVSQQFHNWTPEEVALFETVGREIGAAAERARLFEETVVRLKELEAINKVSTMLRLARSMEEMLPGLIDGSLSALDAECGGIWLLDPADAKLHQVIGRGWCIRAGHLVMGSGEGIAGKVFATGDVYFSREVAQDEQASPEMREQIPPGWGAICAPVRSEQETIGVFFVSAQLPREFTGEDARLLITFADMAGSAIQRMRLNEQLVRHAAELETRVAERTAELQSALQKAQEADRLKSEFVANVNHELRTPLANLILYYQMLRMQPAVKTEERLDVFGRELQRLRSLIEDLLNLSRLDQGQVTFRIQPHDLNKLVQNLVEDRRSLAEERGLELTMEFQPDLPHAWLDEPMMVQVLSNLLTNALHYTPSGGKVSVRTMASLDESEPWVGFHVQDTGPGISPEDRPHLFDRFYRGRIARESGVPGTGLGLAIVKQVVEHHHGRVEVGPGEDGRGSTFTVWIPVKQPK